MLNGHVDGKATNKGNQPHDAAAPGRRKKSRLSHVGGEIHDKERGRGNIPAMNASSKEDAEEANKGRKADKTRLPKDHERQYAFLNGGGIKGNRPSPVQLTVFLLYLESRTKQRVSPELEHTSSNQTLPAVCHRLFERPRVFLDLVRLPNKLGDGSVLYL